MRIKGGSSIIEVQKCNPPAAFAKSHHFQVTGDGHREVGHPGASPAALGNRDTAVGSSYSSFVPREVRLDMSLFNIRHTDDRSPIALLALSGGTIPIRVPKDS